MPPSTFLKLAATETTRKTKPEKILYVVITVKKKNIKVIILIC